MRSTTRSVQDLTEFMPFADDHHVMLLDAASDHGCNALYHRKELHRHSLLADETHLLLFLPSKAAAPAARVLGLGKWGLYFLN